MRTVALFVAGLSGLGCQTPRAQLEPLPARAVTLDTSIPVAPPALLSARETDVQQCFAQTRALSRRVITLQRARAMPGALVGLGAGAVAAVGIMKDDRALAWGGTLVGWSVLGLIRLDRALNPQLRAARQRAAAAEATWIDVRRQMNRWESAARDWDASRSETSLAAWQAEDAKLEQIVARCVRDER